MNNNKEKEKEEINIPKISQEFFEENNNFNNNIDNNVNNDINNEYDNNYNSTSNRNIKEDNINYLEISSSDDFLEKSLITELKQTINQLEQQCENKVGESAVEERCRILSYSIVLVDVYKKPKANLIYPYAKLAEAYYDIKYYEQAKEHFENAIKYNSEKENNQYQTLPEDYLIKLTIKLSRCNLELKQYQTALLLAQRVLNENIKLFGENDVSNVDIYDIIYHSAKSLKKYPEAIEHLKILNNYYNQIYDEKSDKCLKTKKEIAHLYELNGQIEEAIDYYLAYFNFLEEIKSQNIKEIFDMAMKIGGLYAEIKKYKESYDFLKKIDKDYNNGYNRTDKEKYDFQNLICTLASFLKNNDIYLDELLKLEKILVESKKTKEIILGKNYLNIAHVYKLKNDYDKSIEYYMKARNCFKNETDGKLWNKINEAIKAVKKEKINQEISKIK